MMTTAIEIVSPDTQTTLAIGSVLGENLKAGSIVALVGNLGAGKTLLVQGMAQGLNIDPAHPVTSPSYNLIQEYPGPIPLYHFDFYRLDNIDEVYGLGYEEYFEGHGVCAIEWAEKFPELFPEHAVWIDITRHADDSRLMKITGTGNPDLLKKCLGRFSKGTS